ncbi:hypothetical protein SAMN06265338_102498 [Rhodoblastus acidophilus]|uniref:CopG family transcriptional regulator n=1 Tax=Rhodoblastus acidophilus TaxID=1074 RepID=A0A212R462_RHOAC|nr:hypothetical protein [Rhodoblastus acidophilus]MCW2314770.1 hypothetical protein [Rhodoblastus acidophilus]SNB66641.1 hypothetical protein SAMN06265338_102498 [Rhodoblastus acidophilus]
MTDTHSGAAGAEISVVLSAEDLARLDLWRGAQPDRPDRPAALRRLAGMALEEFGQVETLTPDQLNAANDE